MRLSRISTVRRALRAAACLLVLTGLSSCASREPAPEIPGPSAPCDTLYTYAPGFLVVDLAAGSDVFLDPGARDFRVYCSADDAWNDLVSQVSARRLPRGDWAIYSLKGGYADLGRADAPGVYKLARVGRLAEWIPRGPVGVGQPSSTDGTAGAGRTPAASGTGN